MCITIHTTNDQLDSKHTCLLDHVMVYMHMRHYDKDVILVNEYGIKCEWLPF